MRKFLCLLFLGLATAGPLIANRPIPLDKEGLNVLEFVRNKLEGNLSDDDTIITAIINKFTDQLLTNIDSYMTIQKFDPMDMPDISEKFNKFFMSGEFTLSEGVMTDASTLHREEDCKVSYNKTSKYLTITAPLTFTDLKIQYNYKVKYMVGFTGQVTGGVTDFKMLVVIGFDFDTYLSSLDKYEITNSGHISVKFGGHFIYDWMMDLLSNATTVALKPIILLLVERIVKGTLEQVIDSVNAIIQQILGS